MPVHLAASNLLPLDFYTATIWHVWYTSGAQGRYLSQRLPENHPAIHLWQVKLLIWISIVVRYKQVETEHITNEHVLTITAWECTQYTQKTPNLNFLYVHADEYVNGETYSLKLTLWNQAEDLVVGLQCRHSPACRALRKPEPCRPSQPCNFLKISYLLIPTNSMNNLLFVPF